jgi:hypothetical protein
MKKICSHGILTPSTLVVFMHEALPLVRKIRAADGIVEEAKRSL